MPTVPNWIPRAVVYVPGYGTTPARAYPITDWRATRTQVVVTYKARGREIEGRFRLADLRGVSDRDRHTYLLAPDDPRVIEARRAAKLESVLANLTTTALADRPGTPASPDRDAEAIARYATALRDAATKALAELEPLL